MASRWVVCVGVLCLALLLAAPARAQDKSRLESKRRQLEQDIALTRQLIESSKTGKAKTVAELRLLNRQLAMQEQLLSALDDEVGALETQLTSLQSLLQVMSQDVKRLQDNYARVAYHYYVNRSTVSPLIWMLSAESFGQAYRRLVYYRQFTAFRQAQIGLIRRAQNRLAGRQQAISELYTEKQALLSKRKGETERIAAARQREQRLLRDLQQKESQYSAQLAEYQAALRAVRKEIELLIAADVKKSSAAPQATRKGYLRVSGQFERNKGKLPWPVPITRGVVTGYFGRVKEATGGITENDGIYIGTSAGQEVRAVFGGKVSAVASYPGLGKFVIIRHGDFRTVYVNLGQVRVKVDQSLRPLEPIGVVQVGAAGTAELHFLLYDNQKAIDPLTWLSKKR